MLVCGDGRVRHRIAGQAAQALRATELARSGLRRLAHSGPGRGPSADSAFALLAATGRQLEQTLLGDAVHLLGDGPVVIVPPGRFHAIPWALLPSLRYRAVSVAPSAHAWLRARSARPPNRRRVVLARGPGLDTEGAEVPALAPLYDDVTVLADTDASSKRLLDALDGAWLGHIAAHGTFRADSPLFSSLRMADGPLTVYDFEQLHRAPHRLIVPSCDSGRLALAGADELLGLTSSLLPLGTGRDGRQRRAAQRPRGGSADAEPASAPARAARRSPGACARSGARSVMIQSSSVRPGALMALGAG